MVKTVPFQELPFSLKIINSLYVMPNIQASLIDVFIALYVSQNRLTKKFYLHSTDEVAWLLQTHLGRVQTQAYLILKPTLIPMPSPCPPQGLLSTMPPGGSSWGVESPTEKCPKRCGVWGPDWVTDQIWHQVVCWWYRFAGNELCRGNLQTITMGLKDNLPKIPKEGEQYWGPGSLTVS